MVSGARDRAARAPMASLKTRLARGERLVWTTLTIAAEELVLLVQQAGYDFVMIDALNGAFGAMDSVARIIRTCNLIGLPCIYRSNCDDDLIRALDLGADGIACMNITSGAAMQALVGRALYHPLGRRRPNPFTPHGSFGVGDFGAIKKRWNAECVIWVFIEEAVSSLAAIEEILSVGQVDIAYLGQYVSAGRSETMVLARRFAEIARACQVAVAGFQYCTADDKYGAADALKFDLQHPSVIGVSADVYLAYQGLKAAKERIDAAYPGAAAGALSTTSTQSGDLS